MDRRTFVALALAAPFAGARHALAASPSADARRMAVLPWPGDAGMATVMNTLAERGWVEGRNLTVLRRGTPADTGIAELAAAVVNDRPDLVIVVGTARAKAMMGASRSIPVVFSIGSDPVAAGLVATLAHPGGNLTGFTSDIAGFEGKRLAMLKEAMPGVARVAVFTSASQQPYWEAMRPRIDAAYEAARMTRLEIRVDGRSGIEAAVHEARERGAQAIVLPGDGFWYENRAALVQAATQARLPILAADPDVARAGALLSFAADESEGDRLVAELADRILRGAKPADLPVRLASRYIVTANAKAAAALGLTLPPSLLGRADEVIR